MLTEIIENNDSANSLFIFTFRGSIFASLYTGTKRHISNDIIIAKSKFSLIIWFMYLLLKITVQLREQIIIIRAKILNHGKSVIVEKVK